MTSEYLPERVQQRLDPFTLPKWSSTEPICPPLPANEVDAEEVLQEDTIEKFDALKMGALDMLDQIAIRAEAEKERQEKEQKKLERGERQKNQSPYFFDPSINDKIVLWRGDICSLDIDAIVNTTNERLNDHSGISGRIHHFAGPQLAAVCAASEGCPTGDAMITPAFNLYAKSIIHTVGPRYSVRYQTAAENALHGCYRRSLEVLKENDLSTIAFPVVNTERKGYPRKPACHIGLRTVRKFLEKFGNGVTLVVLCMSQQDWDLYNQILPLYFPRNTGEHAAAFSQLPQHTGNELGETIIDERKVRIKPLHQPKTLEEVPYIASGPAARFAEPGEPACVDDHFLGTAENPDDVRRREDSLKPKKERAREAADRLYQSYLRRSHQEPLADLAALNFVYPSGVDSQNRPIVVFVAKHLPATGDLDRVLLYIIRTLDPIVVADYNIIYVHTASTNENKPPLAWIQFVSGIFDRKYKKNMKRLYIVHPTFWVKMVVWFTKAFVKKKFYKKIHYIPMLGELYEDFDHTTLQLPPFVKKWDVKHNGNNWERRPKNAKDENSEL